MEKDSETYKGENSYLKLYIQARYWIKLKEHLEFRPNLFK